MDLVPTTHPANWEASFLQLAKTKIHFKHNESENPSLKNQSLVHFASAKEDL